MSERFLLECPNCGASIDESIAVCPYCHWLIPGREVSGYLQDFFNKLSAAKSQKEKIEIIKIFPIPNTKEAILEFMVIASSNFDLQYYENHLEVEDISDAWLTKIEQCYQKAKMYLIDTPYFGKVEVQYNKIKSKCTELQEKLNEAESIRKKKESVDLFKTSKLRIFLIVSIIFSAALALSSFMETYIPSGILSILAFGSLLFCFLIRNGTIDKKQTTAMIIMIVGLALLIIAILLYSIGVLDYKFY